MEEDSRYQQDRVILTEAAKGTRVRLGRRSRQHRVTVMLVRRTIQASPKVIPRFWAIIMSAMPDKHT